MGYVPQSMALFLFLLFFDQVHKLCSEEAKPSKVSVRNMECDNEFEERMLAEVVASTDIGLKFEDIGARRGCGPCSLLGHPHYQSTPNLKWRCLAFFTQSGEYVGSILYHHVRGAAFLRHPTCT